MMDWLKKDDGYSDPSMRTPASAAKVLAGMGHAGPVAALEELTGWIEKGLPDRDAKARSEVLSQIHEGGSAHVAALLAQFLGKPGGGGRKADGSSWEVLSRYLMVLAHAFYGSARAPLKDPGTTQKLRLVAAADAARCIHTCRTLAKACLMRYLSVPGKLWRMAYSVHDKAQKSACAATPVLIQASNAATTTVTQELLRLLMLHSCAPEMMAPREIEVADRATEQLGQDFTLRPDGVTDSPFRFDPSSELPPQRLSGQPSGANGAMRHFGPGAAFGALERLHRELATNVESVKTFGKDIDPYTQVSTVRHLLAFWGPTCPYTPPVRSATSGELRVIHGHVRLWQELWSARSTKTELTLVEDGAAGPEAPETWTLQDSGGNELGAEIPPASRDRVRCGNVVGVSMKGSDPYWVGVIRSVHARRDGCLHATIAILSRTPRAVELRTLYAQGEESGYSAEAARQFAFSRACAIVISDGSSQSQTPNLLLPADSWKDGRVYEVMVNGTTRHLRSAQLLRRGDDYVRVTFKWVEQAETVA